MMSDDAPQPPVPSSPVYAQINFVGNQVSTVTSPGVTNEMLLVGIVHLMAQLVVRVNASSGNVLPNKCILSGLVQKVEESTPQVIPNVNIRPG
jgi:hypothetical protein